MVKALRYKPRVRFTMVSLGLGFVIQYPNHNPSGCTMALELTQPLTEMSTKSISWGIKAAGS